MFCPQNDHSPSLFDQTVRDADEEFYATFPEARDALLTRLTTNFSDNTTSNGDLNLIPLSYSQNPTGNDTHDTHNRANSGVSYTPPSFCDPVSPIPPTPSDVSRDTLVPQRRKLRRTFDSPTPELTNGCELIVMHLDDLSKSRDSGTQINYFNKNQRRARSSSQVPLSPLLGKRQLEKKPPLACLFCRGRKIACGLPLPGSPNKTCNQCQRRSLRCEYPLESRRGMRKKKSSADN